LHSEIRSKERKGKRKKKGRKGGREGGRKERQERGREKKETDLGLTYLKFSLMTSLNHIYFYILKAKWKT
jgi:hypothetical protein